MFFHFYKWRTGNNVCSNLLRWRQVGAALVASELWRGAKISSRGHRNLSPALHCVFARLGCWKPLALAGAVPAECLKAVKKFHLAEW